MRRPAAGLLALLPLLWLAGCGGDGGERADGGRAAVRNENFSQNATFPLPPGLEPKVGFWRKVYAVWGRGQVAIHDDRHMNLVYEVANLPGPIEDSYTPAQKEFVEALKARWSDRLRLLQDRVVRAQTLDNQDRALKEKITTYAGTAALFGAADRVRSQRGVRERFRRGLEISGRFDAAFRDAFRRHGMPEDLAFLPHVESSFQLHARSSVGAAGVWQFMPSTARQFMVVDRAMDQRLDPIISADGAARYLKSAYGKLHTWPLALTSYNHGVGGMLKAKATFGSDFARIVHEYKGEYFGFASRNFYAEFLAARHVALNAAKYFPEGLRYEPPWDANAVTLPAAMTAQQIAARYGVSVGTLISLNRAWLDPVKAGTLPVPAGTKVWVPRGKG